MKASESLVKWLPVALALSTLAYSVVREFESLRTDVAVLSERLDALQRYAYGEIVVRK